MQLPEEVEIAMFPAVLADAALHAKNRKKKCVSLFD